MEKKTYLIDGLPSGGPYSHVVEASGFLFISGILPANPGKGIEEKTDIKKATTIIFENIKTALESVGSSLDKVVKTTVFLCDMNDFGAMNEIYKSYFTANQPARSCIAVKALPGGYPVEIEAIAIK